MASIYPSHHLCAYMHTHTHTHIYIYIYMGLYYLYLALSSKKLFMTILLQLYYFEMIIYSCINDFDSSG